MMEKSQTLTNRYEIKREKKREEKEKKKKKKKKKKRKEREKKKRTVTKYSLFHSENLFNSNPSSMQEWELSHRRVVAAVGC